MKHLGVPHIQDCLDTAQPVKPVKAGRIVSFLLASSLLVAGISAGMMVGSEVLISSAMATEEKDVLHRTLEAAGYTNISIAGMTNENPDSVILNIKDTKVADNWEDQLDRNAVLIQMIEERTTLDTATVTVNSPVVTFVYNNWSFDEEGATKFQQVQDMLPEVFYNNADRRDTTYKVEVDFVPERPVFELEVSKAWHSLRDTSYDMNNIFAISLIHFVDPKFETNSGFDYRLVNQLTNGENTPLKIVSEFKTYPELKAQKANTLPEVNAGVSGFMASNPTGLKETVLKTNENLKNATVVAVYNESDVPMEDIKTQFTTYWSTAPQLDRSMVYTAEARYFSTTGDIIANIRR